MLYIFSMFTTIIALVITLRIPMMGYTASFLHTDIYNSDAILP